MQAVVDGFYGRVLGDPQLGRFFEGVDMTKHTRKFLLFVTYVLGGALLPLVRLLQVACFWGCRTPCVHLRAGRCAAAVLPGLPHPPCVHSVRAAWSDLIPAARPLASCTSGHVAGVGACASVLAASLQRRGQTCQTRRVLQLRPQPF